MDFTKLVSMIDRKALHLRNLFMLSELDPFEGLLLNSFFVHRTWKTLDDVDEEERSRFANAKGMSDDELFRIIISGRERYAKIIWYNRKSMYVNCWHMSSFESPAMWSMYAVRGSGIAVRSTYLRLSNALRATDHTLYIGTVKYLDYETDKRSTGNVFEHVLTKRQSYDFEKELRVIFWDNSISHGRSPSGGSINRPIEELEKLSPPPGIEIECDLNELVEGIYLSPASERWLVDLVSSVAAKYGLRAPVQRSSLDELPAPH